MGGGHGWGDMGGGHGQGRHGQGETWVGTWVGDMGDIGRGIWAGGTGGALCIMADRRFGSGTQTVRGRH